MLPVPTNANVRAILDRIMRRIARRLAEVLDAARRAKTALEAARPRAP